MKSIPEFSRMALAITIFYSAVFYSCNSLPVSNETSTVVPAIASSDILPPPVEGEEIVNEDGLVVPNHSGEKDFFQKPSRDYKEYFRVYVSGSDYQVRQIRGTSKLRRRPDKAGDTIIQEEVSNFDIVNLKDEGIINVSLNPFTGGFELINFDARVPRINEIAKIIQNDVMRWQMEHDFKDDKPQVTGFKVYYQIELKQLLTREEVKERFLKKKKK